MNEIVLRVKNEADRIGTEYTKYSQRIEEAEIWTDRAAVFEPDEGMAEIARKAAVTEKHRAEKTLQDMVNHIESMRTLLDILEDQARKKLFINRIERGNEE